MKNFLLTVAGFDPTGGAGILRDVRTFNIFGFLGTAVITVNTSQNTKGVLSVSFTDGELLLQQIDLIFDEIDVRGVKVGIPHRDRDVNEKIAERLRDLDVPVVFDPVLSPTFGKSFIDRISVISPLIDVATVLTPNVDEYRLIGDFVRGKNLVLKGIPKGDLVCDRLFIEGELVSEVCHRRDGRVVRGTGCAFSSSLTALLAKGKPLSEAFLESSKFLEEYRRKSILLRGAKQLYSLL